MTHDFGVVAELCDDLCVIYAGQTVEAGAVLPILDAPAHPYTRALLACHPDRATSFIGIPGLGAVAARAAARLPLRAALRRRPRPSAAPASRRRAGSSAPAPKCAACNTHERRRRSSTLRDVSVLLGGSKGFLRKTVPPVRAVTEVSLDLREGEILSLVGEFGCGKTTLGPHHPRPAARERAARSCSTAAWSSGLPPEAARRARRVTSSTSTRTPARRSIRGGASAVPWKRA